MKLQLCCKSVLLTLSAVWCGAEVLVGASDSTGKVTFVDHVVPVLESACLNCHNPDESKGGLDLTSYAATMTGGSGGQIVEPGSPDRSRLYTLAAHLEEPQMPPNKPKMGQAQLDVLKRWIDDGLLESKGSKARKSSGPTLTAAVEATGDRPKEPAMPKHLLLQPEVVSERGTAITAIAASPWAPVVAIGGQKQVLLYRTEPMELVGILPFPEGFPEALSFSRNGALLLAGGGRGGKNGKAVAWDVKSGQRVVEVGREFDTALAADISPDHRLVVLGGPGRNIKIYDAQTGDQMHSIKKHPDWLLEVEFSPDGVLFASGGRNGEIFVWEAETGIEFYELADHQKALTGLSWRADSNVLAACSEDGNVSLWEMQNGKQMKKWAAHPGGALAVHFSPDGSRIVSCGRDKSVKIWDLNGSLQREIKGFSDIVTAVTFTHDGKKIISGDWQGELKAWDVTSGTEIGRLVSNPPAIEVQLRLAQQRANEMVKRVAELEKAAAGMAASEAVKHRDATARALAQMQKEQLDAADLRKREEQMLAEAIAKVKGAEQALQSARKSLDEANGTGGKARVQLEGGTARLAELEQKIAALPQEMAASEKRAQEANRRLQEAVTARDAAKKTVEVLRIESNSTAANPGIQAKLAAATKTLEADDAACRQAELERRQWEEKRAAQAKSLAGLQQGKQERLLEVRAAEMLIKQQPALVERAQHQVTEADAGLAETRKIQQTSAQRVEEAKKLVASLGERLKQKEAEALTAAEAVRKAQERDAASKDLLARARQDLEFARYQVDKWQAAQVNLELYAENEELVNFREQFIQLETKAKSAVEELETAAQSLAKAEQTLREAREVIQQNSALVDSATDQVVETALKVMAARLADEYVGDATEGNAQKPGSGKMEAIAAQAPEFEDELKKTATRVKQTVVELAQASRTAQETPAMIEERARQRAAKEVEMKQALDRVRVQERKVEEKSKKVEDLRKRYEEIYWEWGQEKAPPAK